MEANLEQGLKPYGQYQGGDIDSVSLTSGNLVLHIPLVSYPQRGQNLTLDFQIVYNNKSWEVKFYPIPPENGYLKWTWRGSGPTVVKDQHLRIKWVVEVFDDGSGNPITFNHHSAVSPDGAEHELNTISSSTYLSLDGTGIRYEAGSSPQVAIDRNGVRYLLNGFSGSFTKYANPSSAEDPNGNKITTGSSYTDTLGRVIPARVSTTNLTNCPSGTLDAELWNLPAPSGGTATLKFCFKSFSLQTSFGASGVQEGTASPRLLWAVVLPDLTKWLFNYNTYGDLTSITLPTGGTITYSWGNASFSSCVEPATPKSRVVLSRTLNANDGSGAKTWSYTWGSAIGGDDVNVVTDPDGNDTAHTIGALNCAPLVTRTQYFQGSRASGVVLRTVETTYVAPAPSSYAGGMPTAIKTTLEDGKVSKVVNTYDIDHGLGFSWYDQNDPGIFYTGSYGNVIRRSEYDFGQGAPGPFVRRTLTDYRAFEATGTSYKTANLLDLVSATTVFSDAGETQQKARTEYKYDESSLQPSGITTQRNASPPGPRGNLTTVRRWLNPGGTYLSSPTTYFDTGMVYQAKDPLLHTTTYTYSSAFAGAYPTQIQYPTTGSTTHIVSRNYDFNTGLLTSATDENNQTMTFVYDNMFRQTQENRPDSGQTTWAYTNSAPFKVTATAKITSTMNLVSEAEVDGLGRVKQTRLTSDPEGTVYVDTTYDNVGRKKTVSNPYRSTGESTYGITEYQYDALGRVTKVIPPDGSPTANNVTTTYAGPTVTVTDQAGKVRKSETDALGRLIRVWEPNASGSLVNKTRYFYDTLDNLACVLQLGTDAEPTNCASPNANWRPRTFVYDSLSRLTSATNPESGTITYTYDNDGNVLTKVAPKPNQQGTLTVTTTYTYDALHRLTQNSYNDGATATVKYGYDGVALTGCTTAPPALTIANGKGRRTAMCDASGATSWSYDPLGRTLTEKRTIMGSSAVTKTIGYDYNFDGSLKTLTYPSGRVITYTPSAAGRTVSAVDTANGINYATGALYAPHGALRSLANGASLVSTFYYNNRLQPCRISVKSSGTAPTDCANASIGNVMDFTYNFDQDWGAGVKNNGNVASINNNRNLNRGQRFTYDELNRVKDAWTAGSLWGNSYVYDLWGNLNKKLACLPGSPCAGYPQGENLDQTSNTKNQFDGFCYDAAGNLNGQSLCPNLTYTYDAENRLLSTAGVTYTYDGDGRRVKKSNGKLYWTGTGSEPLAETDLAGAVQAEYVFFNGKRIARREGSGNTVFYYFSDHLGSASVLTDAAGTIVEESDYYPFGGERVITNNDPNAYKFTGKERDSESGLDNFGARYFGSTMGRFTTPDYFLNDTHVSDPQSWNLYTYVRNNPLKFIDPSGEKVYVGDLEEDDRKKFLERANATYGCESCVTVDDKGFLQVDTSGLTDAVRDATGFLTDAINSETYFANVQVSNNDSNLAFGKNDLRRGSVMYNGVRVNADLITLDFGDDRHISGDALAKSTFLNTVFAHEIRHGFPTIETDPRGSGTGPVVDAVNRITDALGLPRRLSYATQTVSGFSVQRFSQRTVDKKGRLREQILQILWRRENTGGGNR